MRACVFCKLMGKLDGTRAPIFILTHLYFFSSIPLLPCPPRPVRPLYFRGFRLPDGQAVGGRRDCLHGPVCHELRLLGKDTFRLLSCFYYSSFCFNCVSEILCSVYERDQI